MYDALYSRNGVNTLPAKVKSKPASVTDVVKSAEFSYTDENGLVQTLDLNKVKNLGDTEYAESKKLFPNATQCFIGKDGTRFDDEGRENVINQNLVIVQAVRMTKGDFGPWFLLRCGHPTKGEISIPAPGKVSNEAIESMSGIALKDKIDPITKKLIAKAGEVFKASELPVWSRFEYVANAGDYNGYFVIYPALKELVEVESDE
jgi:hypothetical protein